MDRNKRITKPKYEIIKEALLERIRTGQFSSDAVFCTEKMLSEQYEVSRITAKRAIEDLEQQGILYRKRGVGSFVSQKIPPVSSSASETDSKSKMVSLLLPFATTQGNISETIGSLSAALAEKGYFLSIHITGSSSPKERATLELLRSQNIAGLVYYPKRDNIHLEQLNDFLFANRPVVIIDKQTDCPYLNNVVCDNYDGGRQLTRHLLEQGHRNIAFFTTAPLSETSSVRDRFGGFLHEIKAAGIMPDSRQLITWPHALSTEDALSTEITPFQQQLLTLRQNGITALLFRSESLHFSQKMIRLPNSSFSPAVPLALGFRKISASVVLMTRVSAGVLKLPLFIRTLKASDGKPAGFSFPHWKTLRRNRKKLCCR